MAGRSSNFSCRVIFKRAEYLSTPHQYHRARAHGLAAKTLAREIPLATQANHEERKF